MTGVHDLFKACGASPEDILTNIKNALKIQASEGLDFDASGANEISTVFAKLMTSEEGTPLERFQAAAQLAQFVCSFGKQKFDVAKTLLQGSYVSSLCALTTAAVAAVRETAITLEDSCEIISNLVKAIDDAAKMIYKEDRRRIKGRTLFGEAAVPVMLDVLLLLNDVPIEDIKHILSACALATEFLAITVQHFPVNCKAFLSSPKLDNGKALALLLQRCGNYSIQLDVCEILYHCFVEAEKIRNDASNYAGDVTKDFPELKAFPLSASLKKLASRDTQEMNFPKELKTVIMKYNKSLKTMARVTTLSAKEIIIAGESAVMAPGNWVDFGTTSLTLNLILDDPSNGNAGGGGGNGKSAPKLFSQEENTLIQDGLGSQSQPDDVHEDPMPAIQEVFYSEMKGAKLSVQSNGTATLAFSLSKLGSDLVDAGYGSTPAADGTYHHVFTFETAVLVTLCSETRLVAAAMESAGISLSSVLSAAAAAGNGNGGAEADTSQRPKKVSMAVAIPPRVKVSGLRNPPTKDNVFAQMERMKQNAANTNSTAAGVSGVSRNAPPRRPPSSAAAPAAGAAAPTAAADVDVEDKKANPPATKRQWKSAKRPGSAEEAVKPSDKEVNEAAEPVEPAAGKLKKPAAGAKGKGKAKTKPTATEPETKNDNQETTAPTRKGRGAATKKAPVKKPTAAAAKKAAAAAKQKQTKTKLATLEDPIEDSAIPSLPVDNVPTQNQSPAVISEADRPYLEGDALPDWMLDTAPAPSQNFQSQYAASPDQRRPTPPLYDSSDDEDEGLAMMKVFNNAAAEEKAVLERAAVEAEAVAVARTEKKKLAAAAAAAAPAADPYEFTTTEEPKKVANTKEKAVPNPQKPRGAVQTKRQPAAKKQKSAAAKPAATAVEKKKPPPKKTSAAIKKTDTSTIPDGASGRKQPRRAAAAQAVTKTKNQLKSQSIDLTDLTSDDDDDNEDNLDNNINNDTTAAGGIKYNGVYGEVNVFVEDDSDDGWVPGAQAPPSRLLLEDTTTDRGEDEIQEEDENGSGSGSGDDEGRVFGEEYALISQNIPPSAAPQPGGKGGSAGLKAALADGGGNNEDATALARDAEENGVNNNGMEAADVLRKRVSPSSAVKKGKGRLSNMLPVGGARTGSGGKGGKGAGAGSGGKSSGGGVQKKTQASKKTPAKLQTETPAVVAGKKRDIGSEEPKTKTKTKAVSKAKAALVAGATAAQKRKSTTANKKKAAAAVVQQQLESNSTGDDEDQEQQQQQQMEVEDGYAFEFTVAEAQKKSAAAPAPFAAPAAAKKKPVSTKAATKAPAAATAKAKTVNSKKSAAARSIWGDVDMEELLEEDEYEEEERNITKPILPASKKKGKTTTAAAAKKNKTNRKNITKKKEMNFDEFNFDEPDADFEINLDSESEDDEEAAVAGGVRGGKKRGRGGGGGGDAAALLQMLQGRLGGANSGLDSEDDYDEDLDDDDEDEDGLGSSGFTQVQAALAQSMAARQRKAQRVRAAQVKKLEKETKGEITKVQNEVQAGVAAAEAKAAEVLAVVEEKLSENENQIRAVQAEYELKMNELSEMQRVLAAEAERVGQEAARHVAEAKNRGKRKLHEAFAAVKGKLEEGKRRIQRAAKRAKRMPDLASLLVPLFASG